MDFDQEQAAPRAYVSGPARIRVTENGPVRASIEVARETEGSRFVQTVSLAAGDAGNRVEFRNAVDWKTLAANLKATFPLAASNQNATYNWDIGTIQRPTESARQFEVASHRWIDLADKSGSFGATILTDCKNGSDKLDDHTIRLTLIRTPGVQPSMNGRMPGYSDQANQDWGHHEILFGLAGHAGDWRQAQTDWQGYRLNEPLLAFETSKHAGKLGKNFSLLRIDNPRIRVMALKKAEMSDEIILRMVEADGKPQQNVKVSFAGPIAAAREVNGQEQPLGSSTITRGTLVTSFTAYQPRTFALRLGPAPAKLNPARSTPAALQYDASVATNDDTKTVGGGFDGKGNALPAEMLPTRIDFHGVDFKLSTGAAKGQIVALPPGRYNRVYILAAATDGDQTSAFKVGATLVTLNVQDWSGFVGQWDTRVWKNEPPRDWAISANHAAWPPPANWPKAWSPRYPEDYAGLEPGYVKRAEIAWYASHHHTAEGLNEPYQYSYLFAYSLDLTGNAETLTLPDNDKIRVLAVSVAEENPAVRPVQPLYDTLGRSEPPEAQHQAAR
jgi:alpha-mannosidase